MRLQRVHVSFVAACACVTNVNVCMQCREEIGKKEREERKRKRKKKGNIKDDDKDDDETLQ